MSGNVWSPFVPIRWRLAVPMVLVSGILQLAGMGAALQYGITGGAVWIIAVLTGISFGPLVMLTVLWAFECERCGS